MLSVRALARLHVCRLCVCVCVGSELCTCVCMCACVCVCVYAHEWQDSLVAVLAVVVLVQDDARVLGSARHVALPPDVLTQHRAHVRVVAALPRVERLRPRYRLVNAHACAKRFWCRFTLTVLPGKLPAKARKTFLDSTRALLLQALCAMGSHRVVLTPSNALRRCLWFWTISGSTCRPHQVALAQYGGSASTCAAFVRQVNDNPGEGLVISSRG